MDNNRLETTIGKLLRTGVLSAAALVALGGIAYLYGNHGLKVNYRTFVANAPAMRTLAGITQSAMHLQPQGLMQFGLLLLIATPIARVVMAVIGFALEKDRLYTIISAIVLAILIFSLMRAT